MKSNSKLILALVGLGALVWAGCETTKFPTTYLATSGPSPALVTDFESGFVVNSNLAEANRSNNKVGTAGTITMALYDSSVTTLITPLFVLTSPGANGAGVCAHITGSFKDAGDTKYPALSLQIPLEAANFYYDASFFTGVKFHIKVAAADAAISRTFSIPIGLTTKPSAGGVCDQPPYDATNNACYNDFAVAFSNTGGAWVSMTVPFSSMARGAYGPTLNPNTLIGTNLQQVLMLKWSEGNQNTKGTVNVDFSVDDVEFF